MRALFSIVVLLLGVGASAFAHPLLLISIDGMRPEYVTEADAHGLKLPTLRCFMSDGSYADSVRNVTPTVTYPNHTTLITGVEPAKHGIGANGPFDPMLQNNSGWYWYASDIKAPTLWAAADKAGLVTASVAWPVTVAAAGIRYNLTDFGPHGTDSVKALEALSRPDGLLPALEASVGPYLDSDTIEGDQNHTRFALEILKRDKPGFMTVHLEALDHASHGYGPFSPQAGRALETIDGLVGQLRDTALANDPDTVVAVVSDHGFAAIKQILNLRVAFVKAGLITLAPSVPGVAPHVLSWKAALWNAGGSAAIMLKDPGDTATKDQIRALLHRLQSDPANGISEVLEGAALAELGGWPGAALVVDMRSDAMIGGDLESDELIHTAADNSVLGGQHGFLASHPEMHSAFFIARTSIAKGHDLGTIDMRQIAPTLAKALSVALPSATQPALAVFKKN